MVIDEEGEVVRRQVMVGLIGHVKKYLGSILNILKVYLTKETTKNVMWTITC